MFRFATHKKHSVLDILRRRSAQAFLGGAPLCLKTLELTGRVVGSSVPDDNRDCIETGSAARKSRRCQVLDTFLCSAIAPHKNTRTDRAWCQVE